MIGPLDVSLFGTRNGPSPRTTVVPVEGSTAVPDDTPQSALPRREKRRSRRLYKKTTYTFIALVNKKNSNNSLETNVPVSLWGGRPKKLPRGHRRRSCLYLRALRLVEGYEIAIAYINSGANAFFFCWYLVFLASHHGSHRPFWFFNPNYKPISFAVIRLKIYRIYGFFF